MIYALISLQNILHLAARALEAKDWRVCGQLFLIIDEVQQFMEEQKICLKFIDPVELHLNLATHKSATMLNSQLVTQVQKTFTNMLAWVTASESDLMKSKHEKEIKAAF